ncbi:MAG: hypothetical protein CH6_3221 [Candidatus Kapaibacterium sp.]|nr:MAG: hypothetical protein CH6_3221 [Candidatus Kapabacteria bacterium]
MRIHYLLLLFFLLTFPLRTQPLPYPYNLDFEIGEKGKLPKGWFVPSYAEKLGYGAFLTDEEPKSGRYCLELFREGKYEEGMYGSVMQSIDAKPYRGKMVRFRAYIRAEIHSPQGSAHIWVRERIGNDEETGFFEYHQDQPMVLRQWEVREVKGRISPNAEVINFGLLLLGNGRAWIDSASFEVLSDNEIQSINFQLEQRVIDNLVDFAKIFGIVRYFNPFSEQNFNWDCFLYNSIKFILENKEQASSYILRSVFKDFLFFEKPSNNLIDTSGYLAWVHFGYTSDKQHPFIYSSKVNIFNPIRKYQGIVQQVINVKEFAGKDFEFSAFVQGELLDYSSKILLAVRFDDVNNKQIGFLVKEFKNINKKEWSKVNLLGTIPQNAHFAKPAIILVGDGNIFADDTYFGVKNNTQLNLLQNESFETSKDSLLVYNWRLLDVSAQNGYFAFVSKIKHRSGEKSLNLYSDKDSRILLPSPNETIKVILKDLKELAIPITISVTDFLSRKLQKNKFFEGDCFYDLNDKVSQIAILIDFWNFLAHFNIYLKQDINLETFLEKLIIETEQVGNGAEFLKVLERLTSLVNDNLVRIVHKDYATDFGFPFLWKSINGKVFLTNIKNSTKGIEVGDEVIQINGIPIQKVIDSLSQFVAYSSDDWKYMKTLAYIRLLSSFDTLELTVKKSDGSMVTEKFQKNIVTYELVEERPERFQLLNEKVAYFDLTRLSEKELKDILDTLKHNDYFIFDLRGIVLTSEQFLGLFTDKVISYGTWKLPVFAFPFQKNVSWQTINCKINGKSLFNPKGVYFLIDERTVGIGEVIADIAKRNKIGKLVGTKTAGNPMEMVSKDFPAGLKLYFGTFKVVDGGGKELYGSGVVPQIPVALTKSKEDLVKDKILQKALYLINTN